MSHHIAEILERFRGLKVLLLGDLILDHYAWGQVQRISPEAPIQILEVEREAYGLGGAANVAHNLRVLGAQVAVAGVVGADDMAERFLTLLREDGLEDSGILRDDSRPTTLKSRFLAQGHHLLRADREKRHPLAENLSRSLVEYVHSKLASATLLVMSDYAKGVMDQSLCTQAIAMAREKDRPSVVGPKGRDWSRYRGATVISANRKEVQEVTGLTLNGAETWAKAGSQILQQYQLTAALITLGAQGMYLAHPEHAFHLPSQAREVFDVAGAGDTVLAVLGLALAAGCNWRTAITLANSAAGIVVGKSGVAAVTAEEILQAFSRETSSGQEKIKSVAELIPLLERERRWGRLIVFTNGCFDLLHPGHVRYLQYCKSRGEILVVGLNNDRSVRANKGPDRPVTSERDRAEMLAALAAVDYVVLFEEATPARLIEAVRPDVLVKGSDWATKGVVGRELVESYGGIVELYPLEENYSTTAIIEKIRVNSDP